MLGSPKIWLNEIKKPMYPICDPKQLDKNIVTSQEENFIDIQGLIKVQKYTRKGAKY